ncbi:transglycosylase family protein, partial [Streptomyces sp. A1136]|uniref:transglycosylase family protein n=1 Tax=Streptomyces sp. A1136 TaxID=2563102 RepID=UPI00113B5A09
MAIAHRLARPGSVAVTAAACSLLLGLALTTRTAHAASVSTWDKVAHCESTDDWSINTGNGFYGGLQITLENWQHYGGTQYAARPDLATKKQQILIAEKILKDQGPDAWTCAPGTDLATDKANPYPEDNLPSAVFTQTTAADFNGDGQADIVARDSSGTLKMWTHNAGGYFN